MGFAVTLLYKDELFFEERIFYGTLIGFFTSTWIGYIEALFFGLDLNTIIFTSAVLLILTLIILLINFSLVSKRIVPPLKNLLKSEVFFQILFVYAYQSLSQTCQMPTNLLNILKSGLQLWIADTTVTRAGSPGVELIQGRPGNWPPWD